MGGGGGMFFFIFVCRISHVGVRVWGGGGGNNYLEHQGRKGRGASKKCTGKNHNSAQSTFIINPPLCHE